MKELGKLTATTLRNLTILIVFFNILLLTYYFLLFYKESKYYDQKISNLEKETYTLYSNLKANQESLEYVNKLKFISLTKLFVKLKTMINILMDKRICDEKVTDKLNVIDEESKKSLERSKSNNLNEEEYKNPPFPYNYSQKHDVNITICTDNIYVANISDLIKTINPEMKLKIKYSGTECKNEEKNQQVSTFLQETIKDESNLKINTLSIENINPLENSVMVSGVNINDNIEEDIIKCKPNDQVNISFKEDDYFIGDDTSVNKVSESYDKIDIKEVMDQSKIIPNEDSFFYEEDIVKLDHEFTILAEREENSDSDIIVIQ
ncbi:hypothetical protein H312_00611 [Anncaliia algerae PRA339]|uniref:Uncharacterized protein n=1 Tax=Anncaliia algerae PRA339 TaxID=1288291 RepID=A0A059F3W3_9MICR|nr:hypothetical protein H312_00611 [Anncaliia algerae PRA339]